MRLAIGCSRFRIVQQLITESLTVALLGGLAGIAAAYVLGRALLAFLPHEIGGFDLSAAPDWRMLGFSLALSLLAGMAFGLLPALQAARPAVANVLKAQASHVTGTGALLRTRKSLVAAQIALSLLLLVGAGLFARSLAHLRSLDPGFQTAGVSQFEMDLDPIGYTPERAHQFYRQLEARLSAIPGVTAVGLADDPVLADSNWENNITVAGYRAKPGEDTDAYINVVSPGYFRALRIGLLAGRVFRDTDNASGPKVAVVNAKFARHYFGGMPAVGHRIGRGSDPGTPTDLEIVGVVNDTDYEDLKQTAPRQVFLCAAQNITFNQTIYLRAKSDPHTVLAEARRMVHNMEPKAPVTAAKTMDEQREESLTTERMIAWLSTGFSVLATGLSILGLYGVMSFMVVQRGREIGIRMALGAHRKNVIWLVMREVVLLIAAGMAVALPFVFGLAGLIRSQLYGVQPVDPRSIAGAAALLSLVALLAGFVPARRAASADPLQILRDE